MCRAYDAADMRLDAALALQTACEGPRIMALRTLYKPVKANDDIADLGRKLAWVMDEEHP